MHPIVSMSRRTAAYIVMQYVSTHRSYPLIEAELYPKTQTLLVQPLGEHPRVTKLYQHRLIIRNGISLLTTCHWSADLA